VITRAGLKTMIRKRTFLGLLVFAWFPFIVRAVQLYISANFAQMALLAPTAETFREFLDQQNFFVFVITVYVGAGLIANDRRANALQIYLSKPLMRSEYIAGKLGVLFVFLVAVTLVPGFLLLLLQVLFAGSFAFVKKNLFLFPAITVASMLQVVLASFTMLALSSLSKSARFVAIMYVGILFFSKAIFGVLYAITGSYATPWQVSLLVIIALIVVSTSVLERRVRGVEVVT
jgi:ABC-type transport system involved in multi-copper enzyme maturation permease subunit